jgi:electron-transferring-flavoprotein dehydrogenase
MTREAMEYDVVIVGAGPSGLSAAIRLKQLAEKAGTELSVCVVEKGSEVGAHILSGAVIEPRALEELFPDWKERGAPLNTPVKEDRFLFLTTEKGLQAAHAAPDAQRRQLHRQPGQRGALAGRAGRGAGRRDLPGLRRRRGALQRRWLGEGHRHRRHGRREERRARPQLPAGHRAARPPDGLLRRLPRLLTKGLFSKFNLREGVDPQTYGIGIKELWEVRPEVHQQGLTMHTVGWPVSSDVYGGSFLYHLENNQVAVGFVVGLDYSNPHLSPYEEFQRFKTHPEIRKFFEGGRRIAYGARALNEAASSRCPSSASRAAC